ncbi:MAG: class I tRNA ligase family protein, partial [Bacteroidota bacterium]
LTILLAPFAPHVTEELWDKLNPNKAEKSVHLLSYPEHNEAFLVESSATYPVCINGKRRAEASFDVNTPKDEIEKQVMEMEVVQNWIEGKTVRKVIIVPKKMINIVVS